MNKRMLGNNEMQFQEIVLNWLAKGTLCSL